MRGDVAGSISQVVESVEIANMFVLVSTEQSSLQRQERWNIIILLQVLTLLATVAASPLPSQVSLQDPVETPEISEAEDLAVEASSVQAINSRVPAAIRLAILSAANAEPAAVIRSPGYGKRSADSKEESEVAQDDTETEDLPVEASSLHSSRVPAAVRLAILSAANAEPAAVIRSPGYGKRSAESKDESEAKLGLVDNVPLEAVKVVIHSSHGNIAQHYDGDTEYQNAVLGSRFGRGKRETDNFIPFSEYDSRRVNTLKLEQNDFLALPARLQSQSQEKKKRHFSES